MAAPLPLSAQVEAASRMALRCYTHLGLWRLTAGVEGRQRHREALQEYWEHIRFLEHGQLFAAVVELHSLLDAHKATINLPHIVKDLEATAGPQQQLRKAFDGVRHSFKRLRILRNAVYGHRTKMKSYADVFRAAGITPNELDEIALVCVKVTNELRVAVGLEPQAPTSLPANSYEKMLEQLAGEL